MQALADRLGIHQSTLSNNLRVLELPDVVLEHVESGALSLGVAREFLVLQTPTHAHVDDMRAVVGRIVNRDGAPADWRRRTVRKMISEAVSYNEKDWRPIGAPTSHQTGGGHKVATFDTDAFSHEHGDALHTIPATTATNAWGGEDPAYEQSRVWTCEVREWSRQQSRATREANREAEAGTGNRERQKDKAAADASSQLGDLLKKDPVFARVKEAREKRGPNRPVNDAEKAMLGTRAELVSVDPYNDDFFKVLSHGEPKDVHLWGRQDRGEVPPFFDLEECRTCIIGAAYAKPNRGSYMDDRKPVLVCTNREHYQKKLMAAEAAYRDQVETERKEAEAQDIDARLRMVTNLHHLSGEEIKALACALVGANAEIGWEHPLGVPHRDWSYLSATADWICDVMEVASPAAFDRWNARGTVLDPQSLDRVGPEELWALAAALIVHRLREAGRMALISREMQAAIPENVYEPVGVSAS